LILGKSQNKTLSDKGGLDDLISAIRSGAAFGDAPRTNTLRKKATDQQLENHLKKVEIASSVSDIQKQLAVKSSLHFANQQVEAPPPLRDYRKQKTKTVESSLLELKKVSQLPPKGPLSEMSKSSSKTTTHLDVKQRAD
jgi:hypothetical protein